MLVFSQCCFTANLLHPSRAPHLLGLRPHARAFGRPHAMQLQAAHHIIVFFAPSPE